MNFNRTDKTGYCDANLCGVDISKDWLDSFIAPDHFERFENNEEGIVQLAAFVRQHGAELVVME